MSTSFFKSIWFWLFFGLTSCAAVLFSWHYFDKAFPLVSIDLKMNRSQGLKKAKELAYKYSWPPQSFDQAIEFSGNDPVKTFIELEAGGKQAFIDMIENNDFQPYQWHVRNYQPFNPNEVHIYFTPSGTPYGFKQIISEDHPGQSLSAQQAQALAQERAQDSWDINFTHYQLIDASQETHQNGRTDHTFIYQRTDKKIGKGFYRLKISVKGNALTQLVHFVKVPDSFVRRYQQMRSANEAISSAGSMLYLFFYLFIGCFISLFFLLRTGWVEFKLPAIIASILALISVGIKLNKLPLYWFSYHTALSPTVFLLQYTARLFYSFFFLFGYFLLPIMAAEALTRKAFGSQIQLFKVWSRKTGSSWSILAQTITGYLWAPIGLTFVMIFYMFTTKFFNWWTPLEQLTDPNSIATYLPWLSPLGQALEAGFIEECIFRAIPLAGGALIGTWLNRRKTFIGIAFILQAFIFGAVHAGYAAQPAYARLVELIIPSFAFGAIYLLFGLLPGIIYHFIFDAILMSLPLFVSDAPGSRLNQFIVIIVCLIPLLVVAWRRKQNGSFNNTPAQDLNKAWQPLEKIETKKEKIVTQVVSLSSKKMKSIFALGILGFALWLYFTPCSSNGKQLTISRSRAIDIARNHLQKKGVKLTKDWTPLAFTGNIEEFGQLKYEHYFTWQQNKHLYKQLQGTHILPPIWKIRLVNYCCPVEESAEEFVVWVMQNGKIHHTKHSLPEHWEGAQLSKQEAQKVAYSTLEDLYNLKSEQVEEIEAISNKLPNRKDWFFTFVNPSIDLQQGQARIRIIVRGEIATGYKEFIHVPEKWKREETRSEAARDMLETLCQLLLYTLLAIGFALALLSVDMKSFLSPFFLITFGTLLFLFMLHLVNIMPKLMGTFNSAQPFANQLFSQIGFNAIYLFLYALMLSVILLYSREKQPRYRITKNKWILGLSGALFLIGMLSVVKTIIPSAVPIWPDYSAFASWAPIVSVFIFALRKYLVLTVALSIFVILLNRATDYGTKKLYLIPIGSLLVFLALFGFDQIYSIGTWLLVGATGALIFAILYKLYIRFDTTLIPLMAFIYSASLQLQQAMFRGWPGAFWLHLLVLLLLGSICLYLMQNVQIKKETT